MIAIIRRLVLIDHRSFIDQSQSFVVSFLIHILGFQDVIVFGICFFLYFIKLSAGTGFYRNSTDLLQEKEFFQLFLDIWN